MTISEERQILLAMRLCAQESEVWEEFTEAYRDRYMAEARALIEQEGGE